MTSVRRAVLAGCLGLGLAVGAAGTAYGYGDVLTGLDAVMTGQYPPVMSFAWNACFHQDTFVTTNLLEGGGGAPVHQGAGAYVTVAGGHAHPYSSGADGSDRVIFYGAGNISEVAVVDAETCQRKVLPVESTVKLVLGNLATQRIELISAGDTAVHGTALATDSLTGATITVPATRFEDNGDEIIVYKTYFNFNVNEGSDYFFDYNRDGAIHDTDLNTDAPGHQQSDRPFIAIYESTGPRIDLTNPPDTDHDDDGSLTDNLWVGNPFAPMDSDPSAGARGDDAEAPPTTPEGDPGIWDTTGYGDPLLVGEINRCYLMHFVNLNKYSQWGYASIVTTGRFDVRITDGRLYDWYYEQTGADPLLHPYNAVIGGHMMFKLGDNPLTSYKYTKSELDLILDRAPVPEPTTALLLLGSMVGLTTRRRRRK